jgi:hypothetical protein
VTEAEVLTDEDYFRAQPLRQDRLTERGRRQGSELSIEPDHHQFLHSQVLEQRRLPLLRGERARRLAGTKNLRRMGEEGHHRRGGFP